MVLTESAKYYSNGVSSGKKSLRFTHVIPATTFYINFC